MYWPSKLLKCQLAPGIKKYALTPSFKMLIELTQNSLIHKYGFSDCFKCGKYTADQIQMPWLPTETWDT